MKAIRVASVQYEHAEGDKQANLAKIEGFVRKAREQRVNLISFPETCIAGYWFLCNASRAAFEKLAEKVPNGPATRALMDMAKANDMTIGAGLFELADDGKLYNTYVVAMPDGKVQRHRKLHTFISAAVSSGSEYTVFDTPHGCKVGVLTCYDNNLVENVRLTALRGAEILLAPHQTGGCRATNPNVMGIIDRALWDNRRKNPAAIEAEFKGPKGRGWLMRWLPARAHDNGLFLVFSNGVGVDGDEIRTGNAMIIDPHGRVLAETWKADDDMVVADLDPELQKHNLGQLFLRARRPDLYGPLAKASGIEQDIRTVRFSE